ncbi:hypothetical protein KL930_004653 [Ogataea haglerorum]|nr:hypothetical protein KL930_004653 [Ogataea haglerorum]KAG7780124.1 hypothetical protein KL922_001409 [Ogataea haglerorum]
MSSNEDEKAHWSRRIHGVPSAHVGNQMVQITTKVSEKDEKIFTLFKAGLKTTIQKYEKQSNERQKAHHNTEAHFHKALNDSEWLDN